MRRVWLLAAASFALLGAEPPPSALLRDALWTDPAADIAKALTEAPAECLARPADGAARQQIEIGRTLFRSPGILGGPAARLGLSCNACHPNGHANAAFDLPELTDRPGAADVTAEWASAVRGNGIMDPVPIPDLTDVGTRRSLGHNKEPSLERFVDKVVVEEFQGNALPPPAKAGLLAYLRALRRTDCPSARTLPLTLESAAEEVRMAADAGLAQRDEASGQLLLLAAQEALGRIAERLPAGRFQKELPMLERLSREVEEWRLSPLAPAGDRYGIWTGRFEALIGNLRRRERETYFNAASLRAALATVAR